MAEKVYPEWVQKHKAKGTSLLSLQAFLETCSRKEKSGTIRYLHRKNNTERDHQVGEEKGRCQ